MTRREKRKFKKRKAREERIRQAKHRKRFGVKRQRGGGMLGDLRDFRRFAREFEFSLRKKAG